MALGCTENHGLPQWAVASEAAAVDRTEEEEICIMRMEPVCSMKVPRGKERLCKRTGGGVDVARREAGGAEVGKSRGEGKLRKSIMMDGTRLKDPGVSAVGVAGHCGGGEAGVGAVAVLGTSTTLTMLNTSTVRRPMVGLPSRCIRWTLWWTPKSLQMVG